MGGAPVARLKPSGSTPRKFLFTGPFRDRWTDDAHHILSMFSGEPSCRPLVLLPHDIQLEDYAQLCPVRFGRDASRALELLVGGGDPPDADLVLIDFSPAPCPEIDLLLPALNASLRRAWPPRLSLIVLAPTEEGLHIDGFDAHLRLPS